MRGVRMRGTVGIGTRSQSHRQVSIPKTGPETADSSPHPCDEGQPRSIVLSTRFGSLSKDVLTYFKPIKERDR